MPWEDTGSMTYLAEGSSLKDSSNVLAKISPAQSNGSMCLEREAHMCVHRLLLRGYHSNKISSLGRMALSSDNPALRMIDFISIPKENGDVVVLLLFHPGPNLLGRYLPPSKINELLLADMSRVRPSSSHGDIYMLGIEEPDFTEEMEAFDIMDLASFLEYVRGRFRPSFVIQTNIIGLLSKRRIAWKACTSTLFCVLQRTSLNNVTSRAGIIHREGNGHVLHSE